MAKALLGHMSSVDPRVTQRLASENRLLRQRVADLESVVLRLQQENGDLVALAALAAEAVSTEDVLELA